MRGSETRVGGPLSPRSVGPVGNEKPWTSLLHFKVDIKPVTRAAPPRPRGPAGTATSFLPFCIRELDVDAGAGA